MEESGGGGTSFSLGKHTRTKKMHHFGAATKWWILQRLCHKTEHHIMGVF
jgi:hypothetical protein